MSRPLLASLLASLLLAPAAWAANINTTLVRSGVPTWGSVAIDGVTGRVYETVHYTGTQIRSYASAADFEAGNQSGTLNTPTLYGTYLTAMNGSLYGRTGGQTATQWAQMDNASGALQGTHQISGQGGQNDGFNWGGFSNVNAMSDGDFLYAFGRDAGGGNNWRVNRYDDAMNLLSSTMFAQNGSHPGYGFILGGYLFLGDSYNSGQISRRVNTLTGAVDFVDYDLLGLGSTYISGIGYDALNDALYLHNSEGGRYHKISGAFAAFGGAQIDFGDGDNGVPEPASLALSGLALMALGSLRRRRSAALIQSRH